MRVFPWRRREERTLSAFLDGELDDREMADCGDRLILDAVFRRKRDLLKRVADLAHAALTPPRIPSSAAFADRVLQAMGRSGPERAPAPAPSRIPWPTWTR